MRDISQELRDIRDGISAMSKEEFSNFSPTSDTEEGGVATVSQKCLEVLFDVAKRGLSRKDFIADVSLEFAERSVVDLYAQGLWGAWMPNHSHPYLKGVYFSFKWE
jgi:hypothetical protein